MLEYLIGSRGLSPAGAAGGDGPRLRIMSAEEFRQAEGYFRQKQMLHSLGSIRASRPRGRRTPPIWRWGSTWSRTG